MFTLPSLWQKSRPSMWIIVGFMIICIGKRCVCENTKKICTYMCNTCYIWIDSNYAMWMLVQALWFSGAMFVRFFWEYSTWPAFCYWLIHFARSSLWLIGGFNLFEKYYVVKMGSSSPSRGESKKYLSCHHLDDLCTRCFRKMRCLNLHGAFGFAALLLSKPWPNIKHHISVKILVKNGNLPQVSARVKIKDIWNPHLRD